MFGERKAMLAELGYAKNSCASAASNAEESLRRFGLSINCKASWYRLWSSWTRIYRKRADEVGCLEFQYYCRYGRFPDDR